MADTLGKLLTGDQSNKTDYAGLAVSLDVVYSPGGGSSCGSKKSLTHHHSSGALNHVESFEDDDGTYPALMNDEGQYCRWPTFVEVPVEDSHLHPRRLL
jgi:hypothetical protein